MMATAAAQTHNQQHTCAVASDPESVLTYTTPNFNKKHPRDEENIHQNPSPIPTTDRHLHSSTTSTSGRSSLLFSLLLHHEAEMDALVTCQMGKIGTQVEEMRKKQCRMLAATMEQQARKRMEAKEAELIVLRRRNADLEENVRQLVAEGQMWFQMARSSEALVTALRSSLDQAILAASKEGFGDNCDDATSFCEDDGGARPPEKQPKGICRCCGGSAASVLLLPCKHLCLCDSCEVNATLCPVCGSGVHNSFRILLC